MRCPFALAAILVLAPLSAARAEEEPPTKHGTIETVVDALVDTLDLDDPATARLAAALATPAGRMALDEAATEIARQRDQKRRHRALDGILEGLRDRTHLRRWVQQRTEETAEDVSLVRGVVSNLRRNLRGDDVLTSDLRAFLAREDAPRILDRYIVRPRHRPPSVKVALASCLASDDAGDLIVPAVFRDASAAVLAKDRQVVLALERLREAAPDLRAWIAENERFREWPPTLLDDDFGLAVLLHAAGGWSGDPAEAANELVAWARDAPDPSPELELRLRRGLRLGDVEETLRLTRAIAARLRVGDPGLDPWRELLRSPRALLLSPVGRVERGRPVDVLLNHTALGRALAIDGDGTLRVNPHARWELDRLLVDLVERADADEDLLLHAAEGVGRLDPGSVCPGLCTPDGHELLAEMVTWAVQAKRTEPLVAWMAAFLEGGPDGVVAEASAVDALLGRMSEIQEALQTGGARIALDLGALDYQTDALDLLRSSIFYNPRTSGGYHAYATQFHDHHAARLFGTFGWNAKVSEDLDDFKKRIRARKVELKLLATTHDKLIVHTSGVPPWLSSWEGSGTFEGGGWEDKQAHPPKDLEVWKAMIRELALVFREVEGVERYYEFWNEPDLEYWQGSLEDFLALYAATVTTIREVDPEGKVGGCAVNQWDGRIHKKTGSDVLVHELIRFAAKEHLPLDFVSWHHFGRPVAAIAQAKASYRAELEKNGLGEDVELLVTEWSAPGRGAPYGNSFFAEAMLGFFHARVDAQTASCWEEFHAKPDPKGFAPWGLMTQQGDKHGTFYVHRFFDRLARGSTGVAVVREEDGPVAVVSRKSDDTYDLLVWRTGTPPRIQAAWDVLQVAGFGQADGRAYGTVDRFERALVDGGPAAERWAEAFAAAKKVHDETGPGTERITIAFPGVRRVEVLFAESVRTAHGVKRVAAVGNVLACPLDRYEVLRVTVRVEND